MMTWRTPWPARFWTWNKGEGGAVSPWRSEEHFEMCQLREMPTRDLLEMIESTRTAVEWRRGELAKWRPGANVAEIYSEAVLLESRLQSLEREIVRRGRDLPSALKHEAVEEPAFP
jgi:hypothetical protein